VSKQNTLTEDGRKPSSLARFSAVHKTDLVVTAVILAGCAFLFWQTTIFAAPPSILGDYMLPQDFPRLLIWGIALLSLLLPFEEAKLSRKGESTDDERKDSVQPIAYVNSAFMIACVLVMPRLGTLLTVFLIATVMPILWSERRRVTMVLFAILTPVSIWLLFEVFFRVRLIPGLLQPLYY
jgi:putative tricarboxylic transport membrane protein